jgi:hypothetical protein
MWKLFFISLVLLLFLPALSYCQHAKEHFYQNYFAKYLNCKVEVTLPDKSRVDILCNNYAIEVDFAPKWAESVGQSLFYAKMCSRSAGILLIKSKRQDSIYISRLYSISQPLNISVWVINAQSLRIYRLL